jgi:hypothetical protein
VEEDRYVLTPKGESALQQSVFQAYVDGYMKKNPGMTRETAITELTQDLARARAESNVE